MLTAVLCVLLTAIALYGLGSLRSDAPAAAILAAETAERRVFLRGLAVRQELVVSSALPHARLIVTEGQRVGAEDALGFAYEGEDALRRAGELPRLLASLRAAAAPQSAREARLSLAECLARRDMAALSLAVRGVLYSAFPGGAEEARQDEAQLLERLETLRTLPLDGAELLTAPAAGLFSAHCDGLETLSPSSLSDLTPDTLSLWLSCADERSDAIGRLVTGSTWYFAALADEADAALLVPGTTVPLEISSLPHTPKAKIVSVSEGQNGVCAVVFSLREALSEALCLRQSEAYAVLTNTEDSSD